METLKPLIYIHQSFSMAQNWLYWGYPVLRHELILVIRDISHFLRLSKLKNITRAIAGFEWKCIYCYNLDYKSVVYPRRFSSDSILVGTINHDWFWNPRYTQVLITFSRAPRIGKFLGARPQSDYKYVTK